MARATRSQRQPSQSQSQSQSQPTQTQTQRRRRATREDEDEDEEYGRGTAGRRRQDDDEDEEDGEGGEDEDGDEDMGGGESVSPLSFVSLLPQLFPPTTHYCWDSIFFEWLFLCSLAPIILLALEEPRSDLPQFPEKAQTKLRLEKAGFVPATSPNKYMTYDMGSPGWMMEFSPFVLPTKPIIRLIQVFALGLWIIFTFDPRLLTYIPIVAVNRTRGCVGDCDIDCDDTIMRIYRSTGPRLFGLMGIWVYGCTLMWSYGYVCFLGDQQEAGRQGDEGVICKA